MPPTTAPETTMDFHPQDWILIVKALTDYSRGWEDIELERSQQADELIKTIANEQKISSSDMILQVDDDWPQ